MTDSDELKDETPAREPEGYTYIGTLTKLIFTAEDAQVFEDGSMIATGAWGRWESLDQQERYEIFFPYHGICWVD